MSNAKSIKPAKAIILLEGKEYELVMDLNSFARLEEMYGDVDEAMQILDKGSVGGLRNFLWAGLRIPKTGEPIKMTPFELGSKIDISTLMGLTEQIRNVVQTSTGVDETLIEEAGLNPPSSKKATPTSPKKKK